MLSNLTSHNHIDKVANMFLVVCSRWEGYLTLTFISYGFKFISFETKYWKLLLTEKGYTTIIII